jgi:hypothetical protein
MSIIRREYITHFIDLTPVINADTDPENLGKTRIPYFCDPIPIPNWFYDSKFNKLIRVLGATAAVMQGPQLEELDMPKGLKLMGSLTKDFSNTYSNCKGNDCINGCADCCVNGGNKFIMMINNYNNVKEFDVTYLNIKSLDWRLIDGYAQPFPFIKDTHVDLVVELEFILLQ